MFKLAEHHTRGRPIGYAMVQFVTIVYFTTPILDNPFQQTSLPNTP